MRLWNSHRTGQPMHRVSSTRSNSRLGGAFLGPPPLSVCAGFTVMNEGSGRNLSQPNRPVYRADHSPQVSGRRSWIMAGKRVVVIMAVARPRYAGAGQWRKPQRNVTMLQRSPELRVSRPLEDGHCAGFAKWPLPNAICPSQCAL